MEKLRCVPPHTYLIRIPAAPHSENRRAHQNEVHHTDSPHKNHFASPQFFSQNAESDFEKHGKICIFFQVALVK